MGITVLSSQCFCKSKTILMKISSEQQQKLGHSHIDCGAILGAGTWSTTVPLLWRQHQDGLTFRTACSQLRLCTRSGHLTQPGPSEPFTGTLGLGTSVLFFS